MKAISLCTRVIERKTSSDALKVTGVPAISERMISSDLTPKLKIGHELKKEPPNIQAMTGRPASEVNPAGRKILIVKQSSDIGSPAWR